MSQTLVGLDVGTSFVKAGLYDPKGHELAVAREALSVTVPAPGWAEQDPREWWRAIQKVLERLTHQFDARRIAGVGLCAQCPGQVLVGRDGEALGNAIIWSDQRAAAEAAWLEENVSAEERRLWLGAAHLDEPHAAPARLLWLKNHDARFGQAASILQPKDFVGLMLTGLAATDLHTAFLLAHPESRSYHPDLLERLGVKAGQLPPVMAITDLLGQVTAEAAQRTGLLAGTPVFVGTIDAYCDTLAGGAFIPGQAVDVSGTSEIVSLGVDRQASGGGVYYTRLEEGAQFLCGPMQTGGSVLSWLAGAFYPEMNRKMSYEFLEQEARQSPAGADGLVFLPYLQGERAPIWDAQVRGAFLGVTASHDRRSFTRAGYESVAFAVRHVLEACESVGGVKAERVVTCGGGARSAFWNALKANILRRDIYPLKTEATGCLGAAMIAAVGMKRFSSLADAWKGMNITGERISPDSNLSDRYDDLYGLYRRAYPGLRTVLERNMG